MSTDTFSPETKQKFKGSPLWKPWMSQIRLRQITSLDELRDFIESGDDYSEISWDLETESLDPNPATVVGHCLAFTPTEGVYIPTRHQEGGQNLDHDKVWNIILEAIEKRIVVVFNWMFEGKALRRLGVNRSCSMSSIRDVMIYNWLKDSSQMRFGLKEAVKAELNMEMLEIGETPGAKRDKKKRGRINFAYTHPEEATLYAAADPVMTLALYQKLKDPVEKSQKFILELEHSLLEPLFCIMENSILIDRPFLMRGKQDIDRWILKVAGDIYKEAGYEFNIGSTPKVQKFLKERGVLLKQIKRADGSMKESTGAQDLEKMAGEHPCIDKVLLYRSLMKEKGTYVETLLNSTTDDDPYAIFKFRSVGAPTGRFASGGVEEGEGNFVAMNVQSVPSSSAYREALCHWVKNPPIHEMDLDLEEHTNFLAVSTKEVEKEEEVEEDGGLFAMTEDADG